MMLQYYFRVTLYTLYTDFYGSFLTAFRTNYDLTKDSYGGMLGDAVNLMDSVDYCSLYSRLDSGYPWDLPRPLSNKLISEDSASNAPEALAGNTEPPAEPEEIVEELRRKKRSTGAKKEYQCLRDTSYGLHHCSHA